MAGFRPLHILRFLGRLWLQSFKRAVWVAVIGIMVTSLRVSLSQSGDGSGLEPNNSTTNGSALSASCIDPERQCADLPAICLDCDYLPDCTYGEDTNVSCTTLPGVECMGEGTRFEVKYNCRYCYQLNDTNYTCTNNDSCSVRGSPSSVYTANCTANQDVFCLPPRNFMRQRRCNYSTGKRWTTAFLLSITVGGFGIDRFYLNHYASACGKIISFGGLGVWSILDVILIGTGYLGPADGSAYIY